MKALGMSTAAAAVLTPQVAAAKIVEASTAIDSWLVYGTTNNPFQWILDLNKDVIKLIYDNCDNLGLSIVAYALIL